MSTIKSSDEHLTLNADGSGNDIKFQSNGSEVASISDGGVLTSAGGTMTGNLTVSGASTPKVTIKSNDGTSSSLKLQRVNENDASTDFELKNDGGTLKIIGDNSSQNEYETLRLTTTETRIYTNSTERVRIDSSGKVGIGSVPNYTLEIANVSTKGWSVNVENNVAKMRSRASANDTQTHWDIMNGNGVVGTVKSSSSSAQFNTSSDYRLKENVDYTWDATTRLKQLKPCRFNFIADDTNTLVDGFIAHEVQDIVPEAISGAKDAMTTDENGDAIIDPQGIDQSKLVPLLVKTIQELEARITELENA